MADAGRILIIPRGDYDANSTYDKLDLVKYKGTSWLAKKNATGVEPVEGEYWQNMFDFTTVDNLTTTEEGYALDARQGKVLNDKITAINNALSSTSSEITYLNEASGALVVYKNSLYKKILGTIILTPTASASALQIGQISSEFYPTYVAPFVVQNVSRGTFCNGHISVDGKIYLQILSDAVGRENIYKISSYY